MDFIHLHLHSHYSLLDGLATIDKIVNKAVEENMSAVALTDHGVMYGAVEFYQKCEKAGIKPIIGVEAYYAPNGRHNKRAKIDDDRHHLLLLAKDLEGYHNLLKLTSKAHLEGFYYKPRIDWELLKEHHKGIITTSTCLNGEIPQLIRSGKIDNAVQRIKDFQQLFGKDNYYLELQHHPNIPEQGALNEQLKELADTLKVPLVATHDVHYMEADDASAQDVLLCVSTGRKVNETDRMSMMGEDFSFQPPAYFEESFADVPEAISNTMRIAEQCNLKMDFGNYVLPHFEIPDVYESDADYMKRLCYEGLEKKFGIALKDGEPQWEEGNEQHTAIKDRLEYEMDVIIRMGFPSYFLIVADFVNWAKERDVMVGPARGSAAASMVSYLLNITTVEPLHYELIFERFLNPDRISMPDIDIDFSDKRRDEVIEYVEQKYGRDKVCQIITFGTMAARVAIRDAGRVLDYPYAYCDKVAKSIPQFMKLGEALENSPDLKEMYDEDPQCRRLVDVAMKLEGVARHTSTHACGILVTPEPLDNYVPVQYASASDKSIVSQYSLKPIESLGLLKIDFLGLKNLSIIESTIEYVQAIHGTKIDIDTIPFDDKKAFEILQKGASTGVFQLESSGMKRYLRLLKPTDIQDIIAMVALYRPGPMDFIPDYIDGKHGKKKVTYLHPKLEPILQGTYGIAVYQEQILEIARKLAGFSYGEADVLRRAVGKKIKELLDEQKEKLIIGMKNNGIDEKTGKEIWDFIEPFARYGFNRAHATGYGIIAYQTAYLKANYPTEFMAALLTCDSGNIERIAFLVEECRSMGIEVLPPDINESFATFTVVAESLKEETPRIRFGLKAIKNLGENIIGAIIQERKANGTFNTLQDLLERVTHKDLNKKSVESLIKSGCLDSLGERNQLLYNLDQILQFAKMIQHEANTNQASLFGDMGDGGGHQLNLMPAQPLEKDQKLSWEKEFLGLYITEHPFSDVADKLGDSIIPLANLIQYKSHDVAVGGIISTAKKIVTKKGDVMLFVRLEDKLSSVEVLVFPRVLKEDMEVWEEGNMVVIKGKVSDKDDDAKVLASTAQVITKETVTATMKKIGIQKRPKRQVSGVFLKLPTTIDKDSLTTLKTILGEEQGDMPVFLLFEKEGGLKKIPTEYRISMNDSLKSTLEGILGNKSIYLT